MPYVHLKKIWTPLEILGIQLLYAPDDKIWYMKKKNQPLRKISSDK